VHTLGYATVGTISQKRNSTRNALVVGEGKLREIAKWTGGTGVVASAVTRKKSKAAERFGMEEEDELEEELEETETETETDADAVPGQAGVVVFDCELTPSQLRNLESATGAIVLDRTGVIIEIFSRHARTRAARLQVEIARLTYLAPRIRETVGGKDRQGGGIGGKGAGESSAELDKRHIRDRIKEIKTELEAVQDTGHVRRNRRQEENSVALVGYTNAGKSSLMRALTGSEVLVADKLFATLDTTVRPLYPLSVPRVLISDTVGFIKQLPHDLVASFRSTLEEALNADLQLFVVDAADPTFRQQLEVTRKVLDEIDAMEIPSLLILNKRDKLSSEEALALRAEFPDAVMISTRDKNDIKDLREKILSFFEQDMTEASLEIPYTLKGAIGEIRRLMRVLDESYNEKGVVLRVKAPAVDLARVRERFKLE
jgi:GTPase